MRVPLEKRLRKRAQVDIGHLQDEVVDILYTISEDMVLHGGTAVWRCYKGNRFSEDLDFYGELPLHSFRREVVERGLKLRKAKETENLIFSKISDGRAEVRVEVNKNKSKGIVCAYEKMDGTFIDIYTLPPDALIMEKIEAYTSRKFIRDLYDIYHLVRNYEISQETREALRAFVASIEPPADEGVLKALIYSGLPPSFKAMVSFLRSVL